LKTVVDVHAAKLCCSCGICEGICGQNAIRIHINKNGFFQPVIDLSSCNSCGLCLKYCPGAKYSKNNIENYSLSYGYSTNRDTRKNASSGGLLTQLLVYLIETNQIDCALTASNRGNLSNPKFVISKSIEEVNQNKASKYCPISYADVVNTIKNNEERFAVVGLPCQIQALKEYYLNNENKFKGQIVYYFALFCNHVPSFLATDYILNNLNITNIVDLKYRSSGWPGYWKVETESRIHFLPYRKTSAVGFMKYFKQRRCAICNNPFGRDADASFGDAYFLSEKENGDGNTVCLIRNEQINQILSEMEENNEIFLVRGTPKHIYLPSFQPLNSRIDSVPSKCATLNLFNQKIPLNTRETNARHTIAHHIRNSIFFIQIGLGKYRILWRALFLLNGGKKFEANCCIIAKNERE